MKNKIEMKKNKGIKIETKHCFKFKKLKQSTWSSKLNSKLWQKKSWFWQWFSFCICFKSINYLASGFFLYIYVYNQSWVLELMRRNSSHCTILIKKTALILCSSSGEEALSTLTARLCKQYSMRKLTWKLYWKMRSWHYFLVLA